MFSYDHLSKNCIRYIHRSRYSYEINMSNSQDAPRIAVLLGAGASYDFGYPLTSEILPKIYAKAKSTSSTKNPEDENSLWVANELPWEALGKFIHKLTPGLRDAIASNRQSLPFSIID